MYRLRKWYVDCLTADNDFIFAYLADLRWAGLRLRSLTIHLAQAGGGGQLTKSFSLSRFAPDPIDCQPAQPAIENSSKEGARVRLHFTAPQVKVELTWDNQHDFDPVVIPTAGDTSILWKPLALPCSVSGQLALGENKREVRGALGYADYLECTCPPRRMPIRTLRWGRISEPDFGLTYMRAENGNASWCVSRLYGSVGDSQFKAEPVRIDFERTAAPRDCSGGYSLLASNGQGRAAVHVRHSACVQTGSFIGQQTSRSAGVRALLRWLSRNPRGSKFLGNATLTLQCPGRGFENRPAKIIDELVYL